MINIGKKLISLLSGNNAPGSPDDRQLPTNLNENNSLMSENDSLMNENGMLRDKNNALIEKNTDLIKENKSLMTMLEELTKPIQQESVGSLQQTAPTIQVQGEPETPTGSLRDLEMRNAELLRRIEILEYQNSCLVERDKSILLEIGSDRAWLRQCNTNLEMSNKVLQDHNGDLSRQIATYAKNYAELKESMEKQTQVLVDSERILTTLRKKFSDSEERIRYANALRAKVAGLERDLDQARSQREKDMETMKSVLNEHRRDVSNLRDLIAQKDSIIRKMDDDIATRAREATRSTASCLTNSFQVWNSAPMLDWLLDVFGESEAVVFPAKVRVLGEGPLSGQIVEAIVEKQGLQTLEKPTSYKSEMIIVGEAGVDHSELKNILRKRIGQVTKIYSQQMLVLAIISGYDPFDAPMDILELMGKSHPILTKLIAGIELLKWPSVIPAEVGTSIIVGDWSQFEGQTPLTAMGYHVGLLSENKLGMSRQERRDVLKLIYTGKIDFPPGYEREKIEAWGVGSSPERLKKMVECIAFNIRSRRPRQNYARAVEHWLADLQWLRQTFYKSYRFNWPDVSR